MESRKPLKVLQVVGAMNRAGTETMLMNIFRHINRNDVHFDFISYSQNDAAYDHEIKELGGNIIKLSKTNSIMQLYKAVKTYGPYDVVHCHTLFHCGIAILAAHLAGVKIRISHAHTTLDNNKGMMRKLYIVIMRIVIMLFSTNLLACSQHAGRYLFGKKGITSKKYRYFPNTIDYKEFLVPPQREVSSFKMEQGLGRSIIIGHIGRFIEAKNHRFILDTFKKVIYIDPSIKLLLVGDGDLKKEIESLAYTEGIAESIRFVGVRRDIPTMLHSMDVFIFPSKYEGLGLVLLEAQASGIPCLVSEAIQPEADLNIGLVNRMKLSDGPEKWAKKIIDLNNKKEKNMERIKRAFDTKGYSLNQATKLLIDIYLSNVGDEDEKYINRVL